MEYIFTYAVPPFIQKNTLRISNITTYPSPQIHVWLPILRKFTVDVQPGRIPHLKAGRPSDDDQRRNNPQSQGSLPDPTADRPYQHQTGRIVSPTDNIPVFHAQTLPAGTAPKDHTFEPQNLKNVAGAEILPTGLDGVPGSTSKDVYESSGKPGSGMSSQERHHDGHKPGKREALGLAKYGMAYST